MTDVEVRRVGPESAAVLLPIIREAFGARPPLDPPADALSETDETIAEALAYGGLIAVQNHQPVGCVILDPVGQTMYLRRFAVRPGHQGRGIAHAMVEAAAEVSREDPHNFEDMTVVAREELPRTVRFWQRRGFREIKRYSPYVELRRPLRSAVFDVPDAPAMHGLARSLAGQLQRGDLLVLSGELGAGKTTFTQGIGEGLGVRGQITSPTFVIARVHPSLVDGPALVHVDAYRLGSVDELDDLDLDTDLDDAVTVIEWGEGMAEGLSDSRLEIRIDRNLGSDPESELRSVEITPVGPRWHALRFEGLG